MVFPVKFKDDTEHACIRRISSTLGLAMPESDEDVLNLTQFRRIERAVRGIYTEPEVSENHG